MKAVRINPFTREVLVIEGNIDELAAEQVGTPHGFVDLGPELGMLVAPTGVVGAETALFWHADLNDFFGGICFVIAVDRKGDVVTVPPGAWLGTRRAVEFLGPPEAAIPRLKELVARQMAPFEHKPDPLPFGDKT